jgi:hypothetical protein
MSALNRTDHNEEVCKCLTNTPVRMKRFVLKCCTHKPYYGKVSLTCPRDLERSLIKIVLLVRAAVCHVVTMTPVHGLLLAR